MLYANGLAFSVLRPVDCDAANELPQILLLHGWMGCNEDFQSLGHKLTNLGLSVFIPDLPFHGLSIDATDTCCTDAARRVLNAFLSLCSPSQATVLCGYSMGGRLVLEMLRSWNALTEGKEVNLVGAVLISSSLPPNSIHHASRFREAERSNSRAFSVLRSKAHYAEWLRNDWYSRPLWGGMKSCLDFDHLISQRTKHFTESQKQAWSDALLNLGTSRMEKMSTKSPIPLLYLYGENDSKYKEMATRYKALFTDVRCHGILNAAHNVVFENIDAVLASISSFLLGLTNQFNLQLSIQSLSILPYSLPLKRKMCAGSHELTSRDGFLLRVELTSGKQGVGDVAPFPGWHKITSNEAVEALKTKKKCLSTLKFRPFSFDRENHEKTFCNLPIPVVSALEAAVIQALAASINVNLASYISRWEFASRQRSTCSKQKVHLNGVLPRTQNVNRSDRGDLIEDFVKNSRFTVLKIKVADAGCVEDDLKFVKTAVEIARQTSKKLRLDANQGWTHSQWSNFREQLNEEEWATIEYIEEPTLASDKFVSETIKNCPFSKVALDESVMRYTNGRLRALMKSKSCKALVIKAAMFKSVFDLFQMGVWAEESNTEIVLSAMFESGVGLAWQAHLAASFTSKDEAPTYHGLGTYAHLEKDVMEPGFGDFCLTDGEPKMDVDKCWIYLQNAAKKEGYVHL